MMKSYLNNRLWTPLHELHTDRFTRVDDFDYEYED